MSRVTGGRGSGQSHQAIFLEADPAKMAAEEYLDRHAAALASVTQPPRQHIQTSTPLFFPKHIILVRPAGWV
eukprot:scaffold4142_cov118-Isochrysis_galbana.AAC.5